MVTSGNYEKLVTVNGQRYLHIINPRKGYPTKGILSVTVFLSSAGFRDALATSIFVMGIETGLDRINQLTKTVSIIIDGSENFYKSKNLEIESK